MAGDINFENDERRSTGTSTASLTIKRLLSLKARLNVLAGAEKDIGLVLAWMAPCIAAMAVLLLAATAVYCELLE